MDGDESNTDCLKWLGDKFWDNELKEYGREAIEGWRLIMVVYVAKWTKKCKQFVDITLLPKFDKWNKSGTEKNI